MAHVQFAGIDTAYLSSDCEGAFNVSIVRLEYLNEDNIAVVMKYSAYSEYDVQTGAANGSQSGYRTYWLNPPTMQVATTIWQTSVPASNYATLCPAMQRLPRVGTLGAEVINAGVFLFRWVVNAILYTPGMVPIWRAGGACPAPGASHRHSILMNCGQDLFSLDDFFDSLDDANAVVWHSLTVVGQLTSLPGADPGANPVLDILQGMDQYGYASVDLWTARSSVIQLMQVPVFDQIDKTMAVLQAGPGSDAMAIAGVFKVGTAGIAWARFTYKGVSEVALVIAKEVLQGKDQTAQHIWQAVWGTLYDLQIQYTSVITDRNLMACGGLKLMFGLDNPWANLLYGTCAMNAQYYASVLRMAMDMFVEIPMVKCVCKDSVGLDARAYVEKTCAPNLPVTIRPKLYMIVNQLQGLASANFQHMACSSVVDDLQIKLQNELDPVFESFESAAEALASLVDYTLTPWDTDGGHCLDFQTDPHVVVIVPQPVDYFAKCADTSLCHSLCGGLWSSFQAANATPVDMPDVQFTTESLFFPGAYDPTVLMTNATAATEIGGAGVCTERGVGVPGDYCLAVAQLGGRSMMVQMYCVPQVPGEGVYAVASTSAGYGPVTLPGDVIDTAFLDEAAAMLALLLRVGSENRLYLMTTSGLTALPALTIPKPYQLVRTVSMWPVEGRLVVDAVVRSFAGTEMVGSMMNFIYETEGNRSAWSKTPIDLSQFAGQYWFTRLDGGQHMLIPKIPGMPVYTLKFEQVASALESTVPDPVDNLNKFSFQGSLNNAVLCARSMHKTWVLAVQQTGWAWLLQLRMDGSYTQVYASTPVTATMQQAGNCDSVSCEGCPDLATNRLCHAYNKCAVMNCVGTPVNLKRPLCGIGGILRSYATLGMQSFRGGWTMFVELLMLVVSLSVRKSSGANIAFPEDEFMGYVCSFKDSNAHWWSVLTSALNSALNLGRANVGFMYHGASNVDTNADAVLTITMATLTNFLHQLSMAPLYMMLVTHQIYICQTNGVLALMDISGFQLRVQSASLSDANANVVGQCLTVGDATLARYPNENGAQLGYKVGAMLQNAFNLLLLRQIEPMLHMLDGGLAYLSGVLGAMGELLMAQFAAQCNPPDVYLTDVVKCACNDTPLAITPARATETWREYALWCSGTLVMVDGTNNPFIVYNPYSYAELQARAGAMQAYVDCASESYQCTPPSDPVFDIQGVSVLNVLVKCRENFVENQWDPGAYVLFDPNQAYRYRTTTQVKLPADTMGVQACLLGQAAAGASNSACLDQLLGYTGVDYYLYWAYERALGAALPPQKVDACLTFSGPAAAGVRVFQNCVDDETQSICTLAGHAWSPTSNNTVPIGQSHAVLYSGRQADSLIMRLYTEAYTTLKVALDAAIGHWKTNQLNVNAQFFSAEGDVIHQTLDCIFMGPYARVDYWPMPACQAGEECLGGPYWSRDTAGGQTRSVDPYTCLTVNSLPYTCGSPARQSLTRYFVNKFLSDANANTSVFQQAVLAQLLQINATWPPPSYAAYGCVCPDGNQSQTCCAGATGESRYFPKNLWVETKELAPDNVLNSIDVHFDQLYERALQTQGAWAEYLQAVAPNERATYDWTGSKRVEDEARLNPKAPAYRYASEEAMSPLKTVDSTLWDVCHASLKQVFWTLPIFANNNTIVFGAERAADGRIVSDPLTFDALPYDGDASRLEDYIQALVSQAAMDSPLFRHYTPRHAPSPSLVCVPDPSAPPPVLHDDGAATYNDYVHQPSVPPSVNVLNGALLGGFPVRDYRWLALGGAMCPCGWDSTGPLCDAPSGAACDTVQALTGRPDCLFWPDNASLVLSAFDPAWPCPEFEVSAHWGMLDPAAAEQWLQGATTLTADAQDLLQFGRAGVRAGGLDTLRQSAKTVINPTARRVGLEKAQLTTCGAGERLMAVQDLAAGFVEQLFPMAQGVEEAGAAAYCLRYTIEVARLEALGLAAPGLFDESAQAQVVALWRRRCGAQLQLLSLCVNLDVYRAPDTSFNKFAKTCDHFAPSYGATFYTTPECLAYIDGVFYDPCRCMACTGDRTLFLNTAFLKSTPLCRLRFDPRTVVRATPVGWWGVDGPGATEANAHLTDPLRLLAEDFAQRLTDDPDAVGNTASDGPPWWSAEGPMAQSSQDCDMIADWWPDDWDYPIGYHATVPCEAEDTAYRSFHQAFAYTGLDEAGVPVLAYQHDLLRDGDLVDTNFGVNGLCRSLNWGMETFVTNTMRYCTRSQADEHEDYAVFKGPGTNQAWAPWVCSTSHTQLPWSSSTVTDSLNTDTHESNLFSLGTVPNMPPSGADYYPYSLDDDMYDPGPWQEIYTNRGWGEGCSDFPLRFCSTDADCPAGANPYQCRGRYCRNSYIKCTSNSDCYGTGFGACEGVCIENSVDCLSHSECTAGNMCTGLGQCVTPVLTVQNKISNTDLAFQVNARNQTCPAQSRNFSLLGGSYWAYVDNDILRLHGMCSYGDWFKYQQTLVNPDCKVVDRGDYWEIDPTRCPYIDLDALVPNVTNWWEPTAIHPHILYMHPSNCDRDYERLQTDTGEKFSQCAPVSASIRVAGKDVSANILFDKFAKMHMGDTPKSKNVRIPLAKMPFSSDKKYGFLGIGSVANDQALNDMFQPCSNLDQCTVPPFTTKGVPAVRKMFPWGSWLNQNYSDNDVYKCGVVGYSDGEKCRLDLSVLQIYRFMCVEQASVNQRCTRIVPDTNLLCSAVAEYYPAGYAGVSANVDALNNILLSIPIPNDKETYLDTIDCVSDIFSYMNDNKQIYNHPYWVFDFVLYEISFDWFFQCFVMSKQILDSSNSARSNQDCQAYKYASTYSINEYNPRSSIGDDAITMLRFIRGGYTREQVTTYEQAYLATATKNLDDIKNNMIKLIYGGEDTSYPRCSANLLWKIGAKFTGVTTSVMRALIQTFYFSGGCEGTWLEDQISQLSVYGLAITSSDWWQNLTTADYDALFTDPNWQGGTTLLKTIEDYALKNMFVLLADRVMGLNPSPEGITFVTRSEAFVMNNQMLPAFQDVLQYDLDPSFTLNDNGRVVDIDDPTVPHICLFDNYKDDPLLYQTNPSECSTATVNRSGTSVLDNLIKCPGPIYCTQAPLYYLVQGIVGCQYYPSMPSHPCDSLTPGCGIQLLNALYSQVYNAYTPAKMTPLAPASLPWFSLNSTWGFSFDFTTVLDFLGNIMPNKEQAVMCTISPELLNLMNCTNPHYNTLKNHVNKYFMYNGSVIVPSDGQLDWKVDQQFLASGAVFSFASVRRNSSYTFLNSMFDDEFVCKGDVAGDQRVCWKTSTSTSYNSMNPWGLGYWNPYVECDVDFTQNTQAPVEYINAGCSDVVCPTNSPYYANMPLRATCQNIYGQQVSTPGVPRIDVLGDYLPYNLCHHKLVEDQIGCLHDQGLLGGFDGLPVASGTGSQPMTADTQYSQATYKVSSDMYTESTWEIPEDFMGGLFDASNPLWAGEDSVYGFLRVPPGEIGIHRIGLQFTQVENSTISQIDVYKLPLGTDGDELDLDAPGMASLPVAQWVPTLLSQIQADSDASQGVPGYFNSLLPYSSSASCPLKRFAFYSSSRQTFAPSMPSPQRAHHLFGALTGRAYAHPTMRQVSSGEYLGRYTTGNGFCFCPSVDGVPQTQCQVRVGAGADACSLTQTVKELMGGVEGTSHVFAPFTSLKQDLTCQMLLDWPRLPIALRDGSPGPSADENFKLASDQAKRRCHVLDRLQPFQYKYQSVPEFPSPGPTSYLRGACQTRRVANVTAATRAQINGARCVRNSLGAAQSLLRCSGRTSYVTVPRLTKQTPPDTVAKAQGTRRIRCNACSPPPRFQTGTGATMAAESSFGRPFRLSAERMMAKDLREAVCAGDAACPMLNRSAWRAGEFMRNFLLRPESLFVNATPPAPKPQPGPVDDSPRWTDHGWVYCPDRKSLKSGEGCLGSIPRDVWQQSKTSICPHMVRALSSNGSQGGMATVPFFDIDNYTQAVNLAYENAKRLVGLANCIAAGNFSCLPRPWAYHPATYVPSNLQWAQKTVLDYYRLVSPGTCPATERELGLIAVNQKFMQSCPANSLRFFQDVLAIVRLVATELAFLVSTLFSMAFKLITLLFAGAESGLKNSVQVAQQEIAADWLWLKNQAKSMLEGVNRLLVDMLFSTGQLGKVLMKFLTSACDKINGVYTWLMNIWCKFLQSQLPYFLTVLRKGISMIASGFEILQDFMDVVFEGVLPAAFMQKYGNNLFQKVLEEKYSQPTNRKSKYNSRVQTTVRTISKSFAKQAKSTVLFAGRASAILSAGLMAYDAYQTVQGALAYPDNFTLFDFSGVLDGIDNMMMHIPDDEMCLEFTTARQYNLSIQLLSCFSNALLEDPALANRAATSIGATLCWANAQTSLGQSNLFSCHSGSTCCPDNECATPIVCDQCPTPAFAGEARYGCNTLQQACQCSVPLDAYTPCTANQQCGGSSQCVLASLSSSVSYGTIPCANCVTQNVFCTITPAGYPGQCTCYTDAAIPQALCSDASGTSTRVDGGRLCGYSPDSSASDSVWQFALEQLAMVQCLQATTAVCSTVWVTDTSSVRLAVAFPPLRGSGGRRRRLLWEDSDGGQDAYEYEGDFETFSETDAREVLAAPGWERTAAPCAELVRRHHKGDMLQTLERHELHRCAYWRFAGRRTTELLNLTVLGRHDTFLLSAEDLASALTDREALLEAIASPWLFLYAALYHPWARPLRAAGTVLANLIEQTEWLRKWLQQEAEDAEGPEELLDFVTGADEVDTEAALEELLNFTQWRAEVRARRLVNPTPPAAEQAKHEPPQELHTHPRRPRRALLSVISDIQLVQQFSAQVAQTGGDPTVPVPQQVAQAWGVGPFVWPPQFDYHQAGCPIVTVVLELSTEAVSVLVLYYVNFDRPLPPIDRSFRGTLPQISWNRSWAPAAVVAQNKPGTWASAVFHYVTGQVLGLSRQDISGFFTGSARWSLLWMVESLVQCDLGAAVSCSRHKRDLIMSVVLFVLLYLMVQMVASATGFTLLTTVLFYGSPLLLLWYVYGVAPSCFPILPTCLLADLVAAAEYIAPAAIALPPELLCAGQTLGNATCLRSCTEFGFESWADTLAFALCDIDARWCEALGRAGAGVSEYESTVGPVFATLQSALLAKSLLFTGNGTAPSRLAAYRICCWVTWVSVLPYLLLAVSLVFALGSILMGLVQMGPSFFSLLAQTWAFHRAPVEADMH